MCIQTTKRTAMRIRLTRQGVGGGVLGQFNDTGWHAGWEQDPCWGKQNDLQSEPSLRISIGVWVWLGVILARFK